MGNMFYLYKQTHIDALLTFIVILSTVASVLFHPAWKCIFTWVNMLSVMKIITYQY